MNLNKKTIGIQTMVLIGFALTIKLAMIYYSANYDKYALSSFCSVNEFIDCDGIAKTSTAQFWGIPLAYWGMFFYITIFFLTIVDKLKTVKFLNFLSVFKNPLAYITMLGTLSFLCSMTLAGISLYQLHKLCILCVATYFINFIIALIASDGMFKNILKGFKTTVIDFIAGVKTYPKTFVILLLTFITFVTYSGVTLNFVPHMKSTKEILKYRKFKENPYKSKGNILGNENADVVIELYSDYVCPLCYIHNIMLHQAAKEYKNIRINHHNYPLDTVCNKYIDINVHKGACFMSKAALAAKNQGNYWEMSSLLYEKQPTTDEDLNKIIENLNFNKEKFFADLYSDTTANILHEEIYNAAENLNINATPTMYINNNKYVGLKPYYQLQKILEENGAKRK